VKIRGSKVLIVLATAVISSLVTSLLIYFVFLRNQPGFNGSKDYSVVETSLRIHWSDYKIIEEVKTSSMSSAGYDKMFLYATVGSAMHETYNVTISLSYVAWATKWADEHRWQYAGPEMLNIPIRVNGGTAQTDYQYINEGCCINIKAPYFGLYFEVTNATIPTGWADISVTAYLTN